MRKFAARFEYLDSIIIAIGDINRAVWSDRDICRVVELAAPETHLTGPPYRCARNLMDVRRSDMAVGHLPELARRVKVLEKKIEQLMSGDSQTAK